MNPVNTKHTVRHNYPSNGKGGPTVRMLPAGTTPKDSPESKGNKNTSGPAPTLVNKPLSKGIPKSRKV